MNESMDCCLCPETIPFAEAISAVLSGFAKERKLVNLPLYHNESIWFLHEPDHAGAIRQLQISVLLQDRQYQLLLVPSVYYVDLDSGKLGELEGIPPRLIRTVSFAKFSGDYFNKEAFFLIIKDAWDTTASDDLRESKPEWTDLPPEYPEKKS